MLKIETSSRNAAELTVVLSGRIGREYLPELERVVREGLAAHRRISFDLQHVSLVDRDAVDFLATGVARGVQLRACPSYLRAWLASVGRAAD